jgi:hypothetical protein
MSTAIRSELRPLLAAARETIWKCEEDPNAGTLNQVVERLEAFPGNDLDGDAFEALDTAARLASAAITCPETSSTIDVVYETEVMFREGPAEKPEEDPAVAAVIILTGQCFTRFAEGTRSDVDTAAWERAYRKGVAVLALLMKELPDFPEWDRSVSYRLHRALDEFLADVHRAIAYRALFFARAALVEVAESALLFVIGGRQPVRGLEGRAWSRRIGGATYLFQVSGPRPLEKAPAGLIIVTRMDPETSQPTELHALPRYYDGSPASGGYSKHRAAEDAALDRI